MQASNPDLVEQLRYDDDDNDANDNDDDAQAADAGRTRGAIPATRGRTAPVTSHSPGQEEHFITCKCCYVAYTLEELFPIFNKEIFRRGFLFIRPDNLTAFHPC